MPPSKQMFLKSYVLQMMKDLHVLPYDAQLPKLAQCPAWLTDLSVQLVNHGWRPKQKNVERIKRAMTNK
jgi:hypothetical protein